MPVDGWARLHRYRAQRGGRGRPSTASAHLAKLLEQRLIACVKQGRYRYFRLAGQPVAEALEGLMALAGVPRPSAKAAHPTTLQYARTCYDHMAGEVAVKLHDRLHALNWLSGEEDYRLSDVGQASLARLGVDCSPPPPAAASPVAAGLERTPLTSVAHWAPRCWPPLFNAAG